MPSPAFCRPYALSNVSAIGLVDVPSGSAYLVVELLGFIAALDVAFAAVYAVLERERLCVGR